MGISRVEPGQWVDNSQSLDASEKDLIEFDRGAYHHWAIYLGNYDGRDRMVAHFNPVDQEKVGLGWVDGIVTVDTLRDVAGQSRLRINNLIDERPLRKMSDIRSRVGRLNRMKGLKYSLTTNNCENFVTHLRFPVNGGFRAQKSGGLLSYVPGMDCWHIGTYDNGKMQMEQWYEYVRAHEEGREPRHVIPATFYM